MEIKGRHMMEGEYAAGSILRRRLVIAIEYRSKIPTCVQCQKDQKSNK